MANNNPLKYWWSSTEEFPSALPNETKSETDGSLIGINIREQRLKPKLPNFDFSCSSSMTDAEKSLIRDRSYLIDEFEKARAKGDAAFLAWKKQNKYFYIPSILLPEDPSVKLAKGNKKGYISYCMYLAPAKESGFANVCSDSSDQCEAGCLNTAGKGGFDVNVIYARYNKTLLFKYHKKWFYDKLYLEIQDIERKHNSRTNKEYKVPFCIRLNGTSDIPWENIKVFEGKKNIFDAFPAIQFYDYTKVLNRTSYKQPNNYDLTLSRSENQANQKVCAEAIAKGWRIAVVFNRGKENYKMEMIDGKRTKVSYGYEYDFPAKWHGYPVIDGDETDLRFLDKGRTVVGLSIKGNTQKKSDKGNKQLFFVSPDADGSFKSAEKATIFGVGAAYLPFDAETTNLNSLSRLELIEWLMYNDKNGSYTDKEAKQQGFKPLTKKEAIELVKNQSMGGTKLGAYKRKTLTKDQKQYNKDVDAYNWFVVSADGYVSTGYEYKNDAIDQMKEQNELSYMDKNDWKVISLRTLKQMGLNDPREKYKYKIGTMPRFKKGSAEAKRYMASIRKKKGNVGKIDRVNRRANTTYVHVSRKPKVRKALPVKRVVKRVEKTTLMALRNLQMQDTFTLGKAGRTIYERGYKVPNKDAYECYTLAGKKVIQKGSVKVNLIDESGISGYVHTKTRGTKSTLKYTRRGTLSGMHTDTNSHNYKITIGAVNKNMLNNYSETLAAIQNWEQKLYELQCELDYIKVNKHTHSKQDLTFAKNMIIKAKKYLAELKKQKSELKKLV